MAIVVIIVASVLIFLGLQVSGRSRLYSKNHNNKPDLTQSRLEGEDLTEGVEDVSLQEEDNWEDGDVQYQGRHYRYNEDILTFLVLGIDSMDPVKQVKNGMDGGQSDAIFLAVLNPDTREISIIAVNRDTMTDVDMYTEHGEFLDTVKAQITLQHAYGDGSHLSCQRSEEAVSKLFYNLPIHGYCAINMGAFPLINDAVGGIDLTALEDVPGTKMKEGQQLHLEGKAAYQYIHNRDTNSFNSAGRRLDRQKQYLTAYAAKTMDKMKEDITLPITLYNTISKYMVTDVTVDEVSYLAPQMLDYSFSSDRIYSLQGETVQGEEFEEFYVDEQALYELILNVFYEEVE